MENRVLGNVVAFGSWVVALVFPVVETFLDFFSFPCKELTSYFVSYVKECRLVLKN